MLLGNNHLNEPLIKYKCPKITVSLLKSYYEQNKS